MQAFFNQLAISKQLRSTSSVDWFRIKIPWTFKKCNKIFLRKFWLRGPLAHYDLNGQFEKFNSDMACRIRPCIICCSHAISACISHMENSNFESESTDVDYSLEIDKIWIFKSNSIIKIQWACMYFEILRQWNPQLENSYKLEWTWAIRFFENSVRSCTKNVLRQLLLSAHLHQAIKVENQAGVLLNL